MKRKEFLMSGMALAVPALASSRLAEASPSLEAEAEETQVRIGADNRLERSTDGGRTWTVQPSFGPEVVVGELQKDGDAWRVRLGFREVEFWLESQNGRKWYTPGRRARKGSASRL